MIINIAELTAPITAEQPAGTDLRANLNADSLYYQLKDCRSQAREAERRYYEGNDADHSLPHWQTLSQLCIQALTQHSKDLEVSTWLTEALLRLHHFAGLNVGLQLMQQLIMQYWEILLPLPDQEGIRTRLASLIALNGEEKNGALILPITAVPLIPGTDDAQFSFWQYQQACTESSENPLLTAIKLAVNDSHAEYFLNLYNNLNACIESYAQLTSLLEDRCHHHAPPSSNIKKALINCRDQLFHLAGHYIVNTATEKSSSIPNNKDFQRQQALHALLDIAVFFQKNEPHSPLPYLLKRCVRWGEMPLPELLTELISNESEKNRVFELTGIIQHKEKP